MALKHMTIRASLAAILCSATLAAHALAETARDITIPPGDLVTALEAVAQQTNAELLFQPKHLKGLQTKGVSGTMTPQEAVRKLLEGTTLQLRTDATNGAMMIGPTPTAARAADDRNRVGLEEAQKKSSFWERVRLAQADQASPVSGSAVTNPAPSDQQPTRVEEIIVTAQKREQRLRDVPVPVTAINSENLATNNQLRLQDYYAQVPGLNLTPSTQSGQILSIRGVSTGSGNPTVGVTIDDVPLGSSTFLGGGAVVPDIDPADLARLEVLRGPQGTLYGASSISGLIKFVTEDPSMAGLGGRVQGVGNSVQHGDGAGYSLRISGNVPVTDTVAIRASGFTRKDAGFIDNSMLGIEGVEEATANGGRLSALWKPRDGISLKLGALYQKISGDGSSDVLPTLGDLEQAYIRGSGAYDREVQAYSAVFSADLQDLTLTSVSGYNVNQFSDSFDGTFAFGPSTQAAFGVPGTPQFNENGTNKFSQEVRLGGRIGSSIDWLFGGFYTDEDSSYRQTRLATNPTTGAVAGTVSFLAFPTTYEEYAAFGDLTFHLDERFDVQLGVRQSWIDQSYQSVAINRFGVATTVPEVAVDTDALTYLGTVRYKLSAEVMAYLRLASGYRAGGPNVTTGAGAAPPAYDPDKSNDYEVGLKGDFLSGLLAIDASVYYIDWKEIQLALRDPVTLQSYTGNAGAARSKGVELSFELRPLEGLKIAAWGAYNDSELTEAFPTTSTVVGRPGDRLPFGSQWSANLSITDELRLTENVAAILGGTAAYVGDRLGRFTGASRDVFPSYTRFDLTAGLRFGNWTATVFANNLADRRGVLATGLAPGTKIYIQPRTVGVSLAADF